MTTTDLIAFFLFFIGFSVFLFRTMHTFFSWLRAGTDKSCEFKNNMTPHLLCKVLIEVITFVRLLRSNEWLWIGEWLFHLSLVLLFIRHLRYVLHPVPEMVSFMQLIGIIAGYVLLVSLLYVLVVKYLIQRQPYRPLYNLTMLCLLLIIAITGLLMKGSVDVVEVKVFMLGIVTFNPQPAPDSLLFKAHFFASLLLLCVIPLHVFAAPLTIADAVLRQQIHKGSQR